MEATEGHLLGGRVRYAQPRTGFRSGIEPVLLAAAIPARPGDRVLEAGCGAGASLLCLSARIPGVNCVGIERDAELVALSTANATANGWMGMTFLAADIEALPPLGLFDHACANPPYHHAAGTTSPSFSARCRKACCAGTCRALGHHSCQHGMPRGHAHDHRLSLPTARGARRVRPHRLRGGHIAPAVAEAWPSREAHIATGDQRGSIAVPSLLPD